MAGDYGRDPSDYSIVNVMLPRRYYPAWVGNIVEQRSASVAASCAVTGMELDYDQLLAKQPFKDDAVFAWHQDMAYWPETPDTRTATIWLAIDDSTVDNGCMRFVPGDQPRTGVPTPRADVRRPRHLPCARHGPSRHDVVVRCRSSKGDAPCTTNG